ncbi:MAG: hypothetical protein JRI68_22295 [Deltaproteobacteria bacterium]|nr:hypothetical protein [Deltaproteobacteria bacterium]
MTMPQIVRPSNQRGGSGQRVAALVFVSLVATLSMGCGDAPVFTAPDRVPGERSPLTASCDDIDPTRCLLPFPSSRFLRLDDTETGLRVTIDETQLVSSDDVSSVLLADGFSPVSPLATGFAAMLDPPSEEVVWVINAEPDSAGYGERVPVRLMTETSDTETLLAAFPRQPLEPNTAYVVVVTKDLRAAGGAALPVSRGTQLALASVAAASQAEADLMGYHAPTRAVLQDVGVRSDQVLRVWDFVTRSEVSVTTRLLAMQEAAMGAVDDGLVEVAIDSVTPSPEQPDIDLIVEGRLTGLLSFVDDTGLVLDDDALAVAHEGHEAPFRVLIPAGSGDYPFVLFGHGMGGDVHDPTFDEDIAGAGLAKVNIELYGWTEVGMIETMAHFNRAFAGTHRSTANLMQAITDGAAIQHALDSVLGDALAAPTLGGEPNPAAGRHVDTSVPVWVGGSLGGTLGFIYTLANPAVDHAVLNVPGAAWSHYVTHSSLFATLKALFITTYGSRFDVLHAMVMTQNNFDEIDGAAWSSTLDHQNPVFLVQWSIGDPIMPNIGSEMVAVAARAAYVGTPIVPVAGLDVVASTQDASGSTQYRIASEDDLALHGFAANDHAAGQAAREQITSFVLSVLAGQPEVTVPSGCDPTPNQSCDFSGLP